MSDITKKCAFGLPSGSIRALLALIVFGGIWFWLGLHPYEEIPNYLQNLLFIIMGHYFASRSREISAGPPPLYLPKGTVRILLVTGFIVTAAWIMYQKSFSGHGKLFLSHSGVTLILVAGFMLGVLKGAIFKKTRRWAEDLRAIIALSAGVLLVMMVFGIVHAPNDSLLESILVKYRTEDVLAAVVGFYFGSKS